jgi:lactosylceramide 4-alpha-galactosyltransferase
MNLIKYTQGTPLENFMKENRLKNSSHPLEHTSDVVRVLTLSKYGGTYLDLDVISLVPLSVINRKNFACPQDKNFITNAVINFDSDFGRQIAQRYVE